MEQEDNCTSEHCVHACMHAYGFVVVFMYVQFLAVRGAERVDSGQALL